MKILFIIPEEFRGDHWGGVTTYVVELSRALQRVGHDVAVLTPGKKNENFQIHQVKFHKIASYEPHNNIIRRCFKLLYRLIPEIVDRICWAGQVRTFIQSDHYDIVEAPEWGSSTLFIPSDIKRVIRLHKSWYMYRKDNKLPIWINEVVLDIFERWCIVSASAVTSPTKFMISQYPLLMRILSARKTPISIIPYGITLPKLSNHIYKHFSKINILSVGRIEIGKGSILLADAFIQLHAKFKNVHLIFIGEDTRMFIGKTWVSCKQYIQNRMPHAVKTHVHFMPRVKHDKLGRYYIQCECFVLPSYGHENQSLSLLEAMAYAKPVIGSNTGGTPEILCPHHMGLIFEEGSVLSLVNTLQNVLTDSHLRNTCIKRALFERMKYDIRVTISETENFYERL